MKCVLVPILIVLLLTQTFSKWLVVAEYNMNRNFIAQSLCINRAKPKLHCNGKCQMMKRMAQEENQNSSHNSGGPSKNKLQELVFSDEMSKPKLPLLSYVQILYNEEPPILKHDSPIATIFHPPSLS